MRFEYISDRKVTIRKPHQCFSCLRTFHAPTKMNYCVGKWEGDFCATYSCMTCLEIMNRSESDDGYPEGYVSEMLAKDQSPEQLLEQWDKENSTLFETH